MCEQTPVEYKGGDIVWVKLRSCWWPGEVKDWDSVPPELAELKNKSICAVKFFEEDAYEIVKDLNNIYIYNCKKKNEFIKKGLDLYRKENPFMKKFPGDVSAAEEKTGGSPDIIDSPMFGPEKKTNYTSIIFGSSNRSSRKSGRRSLKTPTTHTVTSTSSPRKSLPIITHPRFLGQDDHQVRILIQSPEERRDHLETSNVYTCPTCGFQTSRVGVIVLHNKSHIQGVYSTLISTGKKNKRSSPKKTKKGIRMTHSKTSSFDEDLALLQQGIFPMDSSDEEFYDEIDDEPKVKKRRKTPKAKKPAPKKPTHDPSQDILAEWDNDSAEEEEFDKTVSSSTKEQDTKKDIEQKEKEKDENAEKSCFDFDEEEEKKINKVVLGTIRSPSTDSKNGTSKSTGSLEISSNLKEDSVAESPKTSEEHIFDNKEVQSDNEKSTESTVEKVHGKQKRRTTRNSGISHNKKTASRNNNVAEETKDLSEDKENSCSKEKEATITEKDNREEQADTTENKVASSVDKNSEKIDSENSKILDSTTAQEPSETTPKVEEPEAEKRRETEPEKTSRYKSRSRKQRHEKREDTSSEPFEICSPSTSRSAISDLEQPEPSEVPPKKAHRKSKLNEKSSSHTAEADKNNGKTHIPNFEEFEQLMQSTAVPSVPDVPDSMKEEQNFPVAKMKKFPDKDEPPQLLPIDGTKSSIETVTKHTNPKKRFVKAFEDLEMEEKKKSERKDLENMDNSSMQEDKRQNSSKKDTSNLTDIIETSISKEELGSSSKENQNTESNTEKSEEAKGLEVLKLKSQLRTKLAENTEEKDQIVPKYKKFEIKRTPRKCTKSELTESITLSEKNEQTRPSTRSVKEKAVEIETQNKTSDAIVVDKQELSGKASSNVACSSNSTSQDCLVRKKIEIIPKNHGEVNITLTKVVENNNAKGSVPFKKYLYSRRQGRYSVKYRSRLAYLDSPKQSTPDSVDQSNDGNDKSIVSPVSIPTVEEIEFPKTSIQRTVNRQSLRHKSFSEDSYKSDIPLLEDHEGDTKLHEEPHQQKSTIETVFNKDTDNEESLSQTRDTNLEDPVVVKSTDVHIEQINDKEELKAENVKNQLLETTSEALQEELSSNSIQQSKKKEPKSQKSLRQRRSTKRTKRDEDSDTHEEMDIEKADKSEIIETPLNKDKEESKIETNISIENITNDNKVNDDLHVQESLDEYVDIMTVTPKKKKIFGKPMNIIEPLKSDIIFADNSENLLESKQITVAESIIFDNASTANFNDEKMPSVMIEETKDKKVSELGNLNGSYITEKSDVHDEIVISEKQTEEELSSQDKNKNEQLGLLEESLIESDTPKIEELDDVNKLQQENEIVNELAQENQLEKLATSPEPSVDNKIDETLPIIEFPSESVPNRIDEILISEEVSEQQKEVPEETVKVSNELKETSTENEAEIKSKIESNTSTKESDEPLSDLNGSERRSVEETDKVMASVFVTTPENEKEELSALSTLAAVSELSPPLEEQTTSFEKIKAIEANLTVVSQTDLENVQVEIVNTPESKPVTLTNFSVDFTDGKCSEISEKPKSKQCMESSNTEIPPEELPYVTKKPTSDVPCLTKVSANDLENQMTSLIPSNKDNSIEAKTTTESDQAMTSSKLLEILTDNSKSSTKSFAASAKENVVLPISKTHITSSKDSKHIQEIKLSEPTISVKETKHVQEIKPQEIRTTKSYIKSTASEKRPLITKTSKPAVYTEKIIKPFSATETVSVSVQKVTSKRTNKDIEDIDTFIIQKPTKKLALDSDAPLKSPFSTATPVIKKTVSTPKGRGKAKILQQTIITPSGDVIQPTVAQVQQQPPEDSVFDINSMPIVLGDQILTPESIESMPVVISESAVSITPKIQTEKVSVVKKSTPQLKAISKIPNVTTSQPTIIRTYASAQKLAKGQKNYQVASSKIIKSSPAIISQPSKAGKFIIVSPNSAGTSKTIAGKKPLAKQSVILPATSETLEPVGNKIMIVTNQQGQQQRVLLTPAQQKMLGYQSPSTKLTKAALKSGIMTKSSKSLPAIVSQNSGNVTAQTAINTKAQTIAGNQTFISSGGQVLIPITQAKQRISKSDVNKTGGKKVQIPATKGRLQEALKSAGASKTIVIKNQQGQIVKKIQGSDDALLEQQVQEQVQAIKASSSFTALKTQNKIDTISKISKSPTKRSYLKKPGTSEILQKPLTTTITATIHSDIPPPLTALSSSSTSKIESNKSTHVGETKLEHPALSTEEKPKEQGTLNELIIQDALGNQMTITEGQILALPSETVDGQTQSYMLVSLDKSGNLTPLNNEALLSLDPNLAIGGGDLSNIVLQVDDRGVVVAPAPTSVPEEKEKPKTELQKPSTEEQIQKPVFPLAQVEQAPVTVTDTSTALTVPSAIETPAIPVGTEENQTITCSVDTGNNQQLIISGDPISTQKFIESLTEGNTDLANLLASAEGNILIHTDGQQILINTESENQLLLPVNAGNVAIESTEGGGNPIFATQSTKNQDILAAALADTDVFQQEQPTVQSKLPQSQLSPNNTLFPMNVGNVLETSLTLSSPIMTPLEIPSSNSKKIPDEESDILTTEVPKNVDLPITITDPNISQTVAQQQIATLMATELQNNLDLPLTIADQGIAVSSTEMNSPSYVYSLPSLDDSVEENQKAFGNPISMPLLNEESELTTIEKTSDSEKSVTIESQTETVNDKPKKLEEEDNEETEENDDDKRSHSPVSSSFMSSMDGGLCTLGGAMCSSLSEPPPDMFDLSSNYLTVNDTKKDDEHIPEPNSNSNDSQPNFSNDHGSSTVENLEEEERFRSNGPKRSNFLSENTVLRNRSPIANIDENSAEIPLQPLIVAHIPDKETQDCSILESERSEASSDSLVIHQKGAISSTESSSDTALLNSESSILDSSKRKSDDELDLSTQKKPRVD